VSFIAKAQFKEVFATDHCEVKLRALCTMFIFPFSNMKEAFRDGKEGDKQANMFQKLLNPVNTVPVSTAALREGL